MIKKLSVDVYYKNPNHPNIQNYFREKLDGFSVSDDRNFIYFVNSKKGEKGKSKEMIKWIPIKDIIEMDIKTESVVEPPIKVKKENK